MKQKTLREKIKNKNNGITLIALVITIIVLLILAAVSIATLTGQNGILTQAQNAKEETRQSQENEEIAIQELEEYIDSNLVGETATTVIDAKGGLKYNNTTAITDDIGNTVYIPGGFKVAEDSGTKVEEGIVVEDSSGNQFVWIPVGTYQTKNGEKTNELARRTFTSTGVSQVDGDEVISSYYYGERNENSVAKEQIEEFVNSSKAFSEGGHGGFYIGRYEAGIEEERTSEKDKLTPALVQANKNVYGYVTRDQAKIQSEALYQLNKFVTSELISSYAWDTALNFICQNDESGYLLATTTDSTYGNINTNKKELTGAYKADSYCNIFDLLGNYYEWTTEYCSGGNNTPYVCRGGNYDTSSSGSFASYRTGLQLNPVYEYNSFRIQLYIK